jgi:hypothetical protein
VKFGDGHFKLRLIGSTSDETANKKEKMSITFLLFVYPNPSHQLFLWGGNRNIRRDGAFDRALTNSFHMII